ncbi:cysteine proteinase inhibitor 6-like [Euphorbia lathyris]|uniref:cysteine proteinase inhibitor 6-like n=1 Tax=Euphorbia lathyris TaxID=212925 RepID=UPI003313B510
MLFRLNLIQVTLPGGFNDFKGFQNSGEIDCLGKFAVQERNKKQNALLEFVKVLKVKEQVVAGKLYHLILEAKVWVKPWMNFKQLEEIKHGEGGLSFTPSDLGVKLDWHKSGWQAVPTNHAVKLVKILVAKAKVIEDEAKFDVLLK